MVLDSIITSIVACVVFAARDVLTDSLRRSFGWSQGSEETTERLNRSLNRFQSILSRAEKTSKGREYLQLWQLEIRDLMYDIDDLLDEISYESLKKKVGVEAAGAVTIGRKRKLSEMIGFLETDFGWNLNLRQLIARMSEGADSLDKWADRVLSHISLETTGREPDLGILVPTSSHLSEEHIFGRDEDKDKLIDFLLSDASSSNVSVIAVVGMSGIGKTTLVKLAFNDERVNQYFDTKAWMYVSHNFNIVELTKTLIELITCETCHLKQLDSLQNKLRELVRVRRVLLVLDDVWNENLHMWQVFASPLRMKGIKIIVTTQNESVAAVMQTVPPLKLKILPEDECVRMLINHAFGDRRDISVIQGDKDIGGRLPLIAYENGFPDLLKAAKKCQGLPLAVKELRHRIRSVTHYEAQDLTWREVLREDFNPAIEFTTGMFSSLKLSYDLLPANLRRCIAYCALFPEDYVYEKDHLARLWAAQGFVQFENAVTRLTREDVCRGYFNELVRRSFFLPLDSTTDPGCFKMHGLIHRLCKFVSSGEADSYGKSELLQGCPQLHGELRHLFVASDKPVVIRDHIPLRTYIYNHVQLDHQSELNNPKDMLLNLKYVRSLVINCSTIGNLPNSFGTLKYLKYLRLSCSQIRELPKSIGNLYNLQMLDLSGCTGLRELPPSIGDLVELWFLGLPRVESRERMHAIEITCLFPPEIGRLTSLRTLRGIVLSQGIYGRRSFGIRELKRLVNLQELYITGLANLTNFRDAIEVDMKAKEFLEILRLQWREPESDSSSYPYDEYLVLENLEPHKNLKELVIIGYSGHRFPSWFSDPSFSNLTKMTLIGCKDNTCYVLPALGQLPLLKCLSIGWMRHVRQVGVGFLRLPSASSHGESLISTSMKAFPCLVELSFEEMRAWVDWCGIGHEDFPILRKLTIKNCKNLKELPNFPSLSELLLVGCDGLDGFLLQSTQYNQILRREKAQVDKIVELSPTSSAAESSLPNDEKDKQKSTVKGSRSDDNSSPHNEVDYPPIYGRENDTNRILEILLSEKSGEHNVTFMCVVAPSGVGKTTIIRHIFNNYTISEAFDTRIWVCISGMLDEKTLMREIIESITQLSCTWTDLDLLGEIVQEELSAKKFLLILDGAQNDDKSFWSSVLTVLNAGAKGSMVVVATKSQLVADAIGSNHCHYLDYLSHDNCWSLFGSLNLKFPECLMECRHLAEKCEGIPLCVKMIGGCCHNAKNEEIIVALSKSKYWETDNCGRILPALRVCYEFLPLELRKVFDYCALFPKNHVFVKDHIVFLWISQGFIDPIGGENLEDVGIRYFDELVSRSFFQISPIHDEKDGKFLMHELVHDLVECIPRNECFRSEDCSQSAPSYVSHLALAPCEFKKVELSMVTKSIANLQTLLVVNRFTPQLYTITSPILNLLGLNDLLQKHINMKTLDLSGTDIKELPESIGLLKSLGLLSISNTEVKNIPPQICTLPKLQTLEARNCCNLVELPTDLNKLTSLRHLDIRKESGFIAIPSGISGLTNLRTLPAFNIGNDEFHSSIGELKELKHLKGLLQITGIENIREKNEAKVAELGSKDSLECLILEWFGNGSGIETKASPEEVLGYLQPPSYLQEMVIRNYAGTKFPIWIEKRYLPKLVSVTLDNCFKCAQFPYLGNFPSLKYLCAQKMHLVETLTDAPNASKSTNHPKFQCLDVLKLSEMYSLEDLFQLEDGDFPRLRSLSVNSCPMLRKIPRFAFLVELSLSRCPELPDISDLSSLEFLKIDRVENLKRLDLRDKLPMLEISNCKEVSEVQLSDEASSVKTKFVRCPKLDGCNQYASYLSYKSLLGLY